ncbi:MAG: ribonuclease HII [Proteobacteria bacterium]|jgi:ribonuclease HII|nr:MAG: ribonuclease HII [Pseudomonadota bacterium]
MRRNQRQVELPGLSLPTRPTFDLERSWQGPVAGVDEAGRGAWAGPVVAAAVILKPEAIPSGINDSKKLSREAREKLYDLIVASAAAVGIGEATVEEIDGANILAATFIAMGRAVAALGVTPCHVLVDGNQRPPLDAPLTCVVKGDGRSLSIAAASIIAKVHRDRVMAALDQSAPGYGWARNAGYGTADHQRALDMVGVTPFHRKSFAPIHKLMTQESETTY